ncbi:MAG: hypothetical protein BEU04_04345 [Marine Group III euryarchaeote CG-Bathy1]|uniref:Hemolysin n=1 Tax=Marine Group III euryarchaeote CG-Bathy1 TaxID=1889001 RepID=A0A1J5TS85_9ARCH|nr:MAG: hypothetical protein BEU04_04345 [Marine Group III euryarchaeote CG-Bathy1]
MVNFYVVFLYLALALIISFVCSLLESVILSVTPSYVETKAQEKTWVGLTLKKMKENIDEPLAAILTLNTVSHTIGAAGVGSEFHGAGNWLTISSIILTFMILIFSEIIPKTIGATYWRKIIPFSTYLTHYVIIVTMPVTFMLQKISNVISPEGSEGVMTREEMVAVAKIGQDQGTLESQETEIIKNLLDLKNILAEDVMTPSTVLFTLNKEEIVSEVVEEHSPIRFSRIPIIGKDLDDVIGFVLTNTLLEESHNGGVSKKVKDLISPLERVKPEDSVADVLDEFIKRKQHIFLVVDEYGGTQGIITLEDTIETLLGVEIVDEYDEVKDMRQLARELWKKRR